MTLKEKAMEYFDEKGYNCCQAVVCAYCDVYGVDDKEIFKLAEGFGGGMGGLQETCGALTGAFMAIGMQNSAGDCENPTLTKMDTYKSVQQLAREFETINGSMICRELKTDRVSCQRCVASGAELVEKFVQNK
jgi:C_GCAxxG_C_C family probable redox protein